MSSGRVRERRKGKEEEEVRSRGRRFGDIGKLAEKRLEEWKSVVR